MMVDDTYQGFDVEAAKRRSEYYTNADGIELDKKRMGNFKWWLENVLTPLGEVNSIRVDRTSLNHIPALFKQVELGDVNLDIGGGRYDLGSEYLASKGVSNLIYDTYSRDYHSNQNTINKLLGKVVDTVTISNVLNVVKDEEERKGILAQAAYFVKSDGVVHIYIYEGDRSGEGRLTSRKTWQENRKVATYMDELTPFFGEVSRKGTNLICSKPKKDAVISKLLEQQGRQWTLAVTSAADIDFIVKGVHQLAHKEKGE